MAARPKRKKDMRLDPDFEYTSTKKNIESGASNTPVNTSVTTSVLDTSKHVNMILMLENRITLLELEQRAGQHSRSVNSTHASTNQPFLPSHQSIFCTHHQIFHSSIHQHHD